MPRTAAGKSKPTAGAPVTRSTPAAPDRTAEVPHGRPNSTPRVVVALTILLFAVGASAFVGELQPPNPDGQESEAQEFFGGFNGFASLFIASGTILLGWAFAGRWMLRPFGQVLRRNRVGIHTWTSIAALAAALAHTFGLLAMGQTTAWASGTVSVLLMGALFVTGWWRTAFVKSWGLRTWRWVHWELALAAVLTGFLHWAVIEHLKELA